jgi:1,2-diacylglycerol 3-alpha-glucosyltransferase
MKILIIRPNTSDFGKIGTYNVQEVGLAKSLIKKGHSVTVLYTHRKVKSVTQDETYNFAYYIPRFTVGLHGIFNLKFFTKFTPDYVIMFSDNQLWAKNVIRYCNKRKIPCVNYFGGVLSNNPKFLHQLYTKAILYRNRKSYKMSYNFAKTNHVKDEMIRLGIKCDKIINVGLDTNLLGNIDDINTLRKKYGYSKNNKVILFVGRFVEYKKPIFACEILKALILENPNYRLIIIGAGHMHEEIQKYIKDNNLHNSINLVGRVPYHQISDYMGLCDCLINLSNIEIFGMSIIEAMYYRKIVVAHTAPGPNEIIEHGINGYLIDSYNLDNWKNTIVKAMTEQESIGKHARDSILNKFTWDLLSDEFLVK